jgi:hypothetical protein
MGLYLFFRLRGLSLEKKLYAAAASVFFRIGHAAVQDSRVLGLCIFGKEQIMFTRVFSVRMVGRYKKAAPFFFVLCLVLGMAALSGCKTDGELPRFGPRINGAEFSETWKSTGGDQFIIDTAANTFTYWYGEGSPDYGESSMDYKGDIVGEVSDDVTLLQSEYGYLTIKITQAGAYGPTVGKYFVIHWKELTPGTVAEGGAYKEGGNNTGMDTITAAVAEYTVDNGYFDMFGSYAKE